MLDSLLLAGVGTLAVHEIAYVPGSVDVDVAHAHVPALWGLGGALAVIVMVRAVVRSLRSRPGNRAVDPSVLSAAIAAFYATQEAAELSFTSTPAIQLLSHASFWIGLAAAPAVGWLLARLVNRVVDVIANSHARAPRPVVYPLAVPGRISGMLPETTPSLVRLRHHVARRGPPRSVCS